MKHADPASLHKALDAANTLAKAGIMFICMPVLSEADGIQLVAQAAQAAQRFEEMIEQIERDNGNG